MTLPVAGLVVLVGLFFAYVIAEEVAKRRFRRASEALNQRKRLGL
jgi:hypothetical protein